MIRSAVAIRWVSMSGVDDLYAHFFGAFDDCLEIIYLEPQQNTIAVGLVITITDPSVMVLNIEAVQLKNELTVRDQALVLGAPMIALAA
jgi:hypothetical protein